MLAKPPLPHRTPRLPAVFLASVKSQTVGFSLAMAIALHNIPEGARYHVRSLEGIVIQMCVRSTVS